MKKAETSPLAGEGGAKRRMGPLTVELTFAGWGLSRWD